jgi:hypothetical protein
VTWRTYAADLPVRGRAQRHNPDRSVHVPDHALMAVVFRWSIASVCPPEKRKVGGSTPPLTTLFSSFDEALSSANSGLRVTRRGFSLTVRARA